MRDRYIHNVIKNDNNDLLFEFLNYKFFLKINSISPVK